MTIIKMIISFIFIRKGNYIALTISLIAVFSSPSIKISEKAGTTIKSFPVGAT